MAGEITTTLYGDRYTRGPWPSGEGENQNAHNGSNNDDSHNGSDNNDQSHGNSSNDDGSSHQSDNSPPPATDNSPPPADGGGSSASGDDTGGSHGSVVDVGVNASDGGPTISADVGGDSGLVHVDADASPLTDGIVAPDLGDTVGSGLDGVNVGDLLGGDGLNGQLVNADVGSGDGSLVTADVIGDGDSSLIHANVDGDGLNGIGGSDVGDTIGGLLDGADGGPVNGLLGDGALTGPLLNADVSGPVDANAAVGNGGGDPLINAVVDGGDVGSGLINGDAGNLLDGGGVGNLLDTGDVGNVLDAGNIGLLQSGTLDNPLLSVDTNGSSDGALVVGGDQADAANALITADVDGHSDAGDLGLGHIDLPVDVGSIGDVGGLLDSHSG